MKKRRGAGVRFLIPGDPSIIVNEANVSDPQIIAINLKILGFNIGLVNVYSPTVADSENKKDSFYILLNKTCQKLEKHEDFIVVGDFNAKASPAFKKCCYNEAVIPDDDCNNNCIHLKTFCMSNQLCIASTYFDYSNENRYKWYSCNKLTTTMFLHRNMCNSMLENPLQNLAVTETVIIIF